jgi:transposase
MEAPRQWAQMNAEQLRDLAATLISQLAERDARISQHDNQIGERDAAISARDAELSVKEAQLASRNEELKHKQLKIDQLTHEMATLKRWQYGRRSEQFDAVQRSLLDESIDADLEAISLEIEALRERAPSAPKSKPRRLALPAAFPRRDIPHEPERTQCSCGCSLERIGEDVSEKLDIPTVALLVHVLIAKYLDHCPLYRQEGIFERAGLAIPRSTLAQWVGACGMKLQPLVDALKEWLLTQTVLHADETPVPMLKPGLGRTHRAYLWSYSSSEYDKLQAVIYDFAEGRSGHYARDFLGAWRGKLVCDDYSGYKALFERGIIEIGCTAHARRKFHDLYVNNRSDVAEEALRYYTALYDVEDEARERNLDADARRQLRQQRSKPIAETFRQWLTRQRALVPDGTAAMKAINYSLGRWAALIRYLDDGDLPIDNNHIENRIRPVAIGRSNWLFCGSLRAGKRAAAIMSLIQSAKLNGHDPYVYLKDVMERLPTQPASRLDELLPHRWSPQAA